MGNRDPWSKDWSSKSGKVVSRPLMTKSQIQAMKKEIASGRWVLREPERQEELDCLAKRLEEKDYMTEADEKEELVELGYSLGSQEGRDNICSVIKEKLATGDYAKVSLWAHYEGE